jgi:antitoxin component YwqK of YwqJK toxin-antitoxin module
MKYITLIIGLLVVGCGKTEPLGSGSEYNAGLATDQNTTKANPVKEIALKEKAVGSYELKTDLGTYKIAIQNGGIFLYYENGKKEDEAKWSILDRSKREILADYPDGVDLVYRYELDGNLAEIAEISNGKRKESAKEDQLIWRKIK